MQHDTDMADPTGAVPGDGASGSHSDVPPITSPSLFSIALAPDILRSAEKRRAIMFQRAPRLDLDRFTRFVRRSLGVAAAAISLVEGDRQVFMCASGVQEPWASRQSLPLGETLSEYPVTLRDPIIIEDVLQHPRLHTNAAMQDMGVRAYAGLPLVGMDGQNLGALCVVDHRPRRWQHEQLDMLERVALQIANELALDLATQALRVLMRQPSPQPNALDRCMEVLAYPFGWDVVSLWERLPGTGVMGCTTLWRRDELGGEDAYFERFHQLEPGVGLVAKSDTPLWVPDLDRENRVVLRSTLVTPRLKSAFVFPVAVGTRTTGVVGCLSRASPPHGHELVREVAMLGHQVGAYLLKIRPQAPEAAH
jgi:hypothetical protein